MGDKFQSLLNVTIVYPDGIPTFWDFLCGGVPRVVVRVHELPIPKEFIERDYNEDMQFREQFQQWTHELWLEKDQEITDILTATNTNDKTTNSSDTTDHAKV